VIQFWFEHVGVAVCAISGVLSGQGKKVDLFGVIVLALVTAVGGGTIRDVVLGTSPVFWVRDSSYLVTGTIAAMITFVLARFWDMPSSFLLIADAFGLAFFTILGVEKSLQAGATVIAAIVLGVITGVAGGILRDVLSQEIPMVFRQEMYLYATAAFSGAVLFVLLPEIGIQGSIQSYLSSGLILCLRLAAIRWKIRLPMFRSRADYQI
jgi:uncharacterized membrane protein YeiH